MLTSEFPTAEIHFHLWNMYNMLPAKLTSFPVYTASFTEGVCEVEYEEIS